MLPLRKAVIPVAGYGTRFLPATKSIPKEMLPVVDKPQLQYLVEEAVASGIHDVIFVTGRNKHAIENHFDVSFELESVLRRAKKVNELKSVQRISQMADFAYIRQPMPLGHGDAVLRATRFLSPDEPIAVIFGDDLIESKIPALKQMLPAFHKYRAPIIALARVALQEATKFGVVRIRRAALARLHWRPLPHVLLRFSASVAAMLAAADSPSRAAAQRAKSGNRRSTRAAKGRG